MEVLILDGKSYVKASKAAKELGYATDYVGQLCRGGKVDAHLIGRTWYVNQKELGSHKTEKKRTSRVKAREYAKKAIEEHRMKNAETHNHYKNIAIQYESDEGSLIPEPRKQLSIQKEGRKSNVERVEQADDLEVFHEGEKVHMSGELSVVDVTENPVDEETTVLHPSNIQGSPKEPVVTKISVTKNETPETFSSKSVSMTQKKSFIDKLSDSGVTILSTPDSVTEDVQEPYATSGLLPVASLSDETSNEVRKIQDSQESVLPYTLTVIFLFLCACVSTTIYGQIVYTPNGTQLQVREEVSISLGKTITILHSKI